MVVELLFNNGADVNAQGGNYSNALQAASFRDHNKIVQLLLGKARRPTLKMETTAMRCRRPHLEITRRVVQLLISKGAKVPSSPPTILIRLLSRSLNLSNRFSLQRPFQPPTSLTSVRAVKR